MTSSPLVPVGRRPRGIEAGTRLSWQEYTSYTEQTMWVRTSQIHWFVLREGRYVTHPPGPDGIFRSMVFPGLWLDPAALFADDLDALIATLDRGLATPEHAVGRGRLGL